LIKSETKGAKNKGRKTHGANRYLTLKKIGKSSFYFILLFWVFSCLFDVFVLKKKIKKNNREKKKVFSNKRGRKNLRTIYPFAQNYEVFNVIDIRKKYI
jgi:hypothetical protein